MAQYRQQGLENPWNRHRRIVENKESKGEFDKGLESPVGARNMFFKIEIGEGGQEIIQSEKNNFLNFAKRFFGSWVEGKVVDLLALLLFQAPTEHSLILTEPTLT